MEVTITEAETAKQTKHQEEAVLDDRRLWYSNVHKKAQIKRYKLNCSLTFSKTLLSVFFLFCFVFFLRWIILSNFMQLCEYSDYSEIHLFLRSFSLQLFPNICTEAFIRPFFSMLWPYLPERLCHHRPQRGFWIRVHSTKGTSGRKWFWDGIQWWRGKLTQMLCRKTVCDAGKNNASSNREVEMTLSQSCSKTSALLILSQSENQTDKDSSRNCEWKTGIKLILRILVE